MNEAWQKNATNCLFIRKSTQKIRDSAQFESLSNMKIISCVRFELDFRGQIFTRRRSIAVVM